MAEVLLFHHAFGRTAGVRAFADALRQAGHIVHVPDLYAGPSTPLRTGPSTPLRTGPSTPLRTGRIFADLDAGVRHAQQVGLDTIIERGVRAAEALPNALVYAGFSLGVLPAQKLAQTRAGASGALLFDACVPPGTFGGPWPRGVPVQIHGMDADPIFVGDGDLDAARALVSSVEGAELFLYKGRGHIFADNSLASYDEAAARLLTERVIRFLKH